MISTFGFMVRHLGFTCVVRLLAFVVTTIPLLSAPVFAQFPGGFVEKTISTAVRPTLTQLEIQALLPPRGLFTFPSPYLTQGIRLTNETDCGGSDCVKYVGYAYWRNINNHSGSDEMLIFLTLRGNGGPTLFSYNKVTDVVTKLGPLFSVASPFSSATGEGWYFSATQPTKLYLNSGPKLLRYDVFTKQFETVLDVSTQPALFGTNRIIWQMHSSNDDRVHSATLKDGATFTTLGCFAYDEALTQFYYYPKMGAYDECQIDKSGRWLLIKENVDGLNGEDNRIIDLQTQTETVLLDQLGAGGHSDNGFDYLVAADNWNNLPYAIRLWQFGPTPLLPGPVVYYDPSWATQSAQHISHANTKAGVPPEQQYACGSGARATNGPRANEIICFRLDSSYDVLVVAPVMTDMNAPGGGDSYSKLPKGNLDVTGQYFIWTSNTASSRLDAFIVKVPAHLLVGPADITPPTVSITSPLNETTVSNFISVSAAASDNVGVAGVQFKVDGVNLGSEFTTSPYSISWNTTTATNASHTLTAVARDAAGNLATSSPVTVTVSNDITPPVISSVAAPFITSSGVTITWTTDEPSDTQIEYGLTISYGSSTTLNTTLVTSHSVTLGALAPSTLYHYRVKSRDAAGNLAVSGDFTLTTLPLPDTTPPVISAVTASSITASSATITWTTDETSDTQVEYGTTTAYGSSTALDSLLVTAHSQTLPGLASSTLYHYRVKSRDKAGYLAISGDFTFTTSDSTPPTASITSPLNGATVSGTITVSANASDNVGVVGVQFKLDGVNLGAEATLAPYSVSWNTTTATNGSHLLTAVARDAAGNSTTSTAITVTVNNDITPPVVSLVSSSNISSSGSTITWTTNEASDSQVEYGPTTAYGSASALNTSPVTSHSQALSGLAANTVYHYRVKSRDAAGNLATSGDFTFTTLAPPPPDLVAYRTLAPITVDGVLGEWNGAGSAQFSGLSNSATSYLLWDATNLYVAFKVTDTQLSAIRSTRDSSALYQDDSVEVYIDARNDRATTMQPDDYQFLVNLNNVQGDLRGTGAGKDASWNGVWVSAVSIQGTLNSQGDIDSGYTLEVAIPWAQLGVTPSNGMVIGVDLAVNDSDPASATTFNYFDWAGIAPGSYARPNLWKRIQLADAPPDTTPPSVAITSPSPGATVSGTITVLGTAADNVALSRVEVVVDSGASQTPSGTTSWTLALNTLALANGPHTIMARAVDAASNTSTATVSVTVSNDTTPPTVSITAPISGSTVAGTTTVSANASDNVGVVGVQFKLDGANLGAETTVAPYTVSWDTRTITNGSHSLTAVARDAAANSTTSTAVTVTVNNDITPPIISLVSSSNVSSSGATITWTTNEASDSQVEYGPTTAYGSSTALNTILVTSHSQVLSGLAANTSYHYRVKSRDAAGNLTLSGDFTFTTPTDINAGLVGYWKFDEGSGTSAIDSSGNGNTGTLMNGPTRIAAGVNQALSFDGVNDYVSIPHTDKLNAYPLTIALWMKTSTAAGVRGIVNKYVAGSYNGYQVFINNGTLCAWYLRNTSNYVYNGTGCTLDTAGYNDNWWHHVVFVVDASGGRLYVDGILTASQPWTGPAGAPSTTQELQVGHYPGAFGGAEYFQGAVDEVHIYNRALSAEEVLKLYNAAKPSTVENVVWTNLVNVTATGNSIQKTGGCDGCADAGATSQQQITSGDGYMEFAASETTTLRYVGLSNGNTGTSAAEIKLAVRLQSGFAEVRESGLYKADTSFVTGDVFRVAVESGIVKYYKNGTLFYTSTVAPVYPLLVDSSILSLNGTLTNAVISRGP